MKPTTRNTKTLLALLVVLGVVLSAPSVAFGVFTRPFLKQLQGQSGGVAVDQEDDLWVLGSPTELSEFSPFPAVEPKGTLAVAGSGFHRELAIERSSGHFYDVVGEESRVDVFESSGAAFAGWKNQDVFDGGPSGGPQTGVQVAVDNNPSSDLADESACGVTGCVVYVEHAGHDLKAPVGDGLPAGIEKLNSSGAEVPFTKGGGALPYVSGSEITGTPSGSFGNIETPHAVAVDAAGDIFVYVGGQGVVEFRASGEFVRVFSGVETPGVGESGAGKFGGSVEGVVVDPVAGGLGHLLVSVSNQSAPFLGVVDEFDIESGKFLSQVSEAPVGVEGSGGVPLQGGEELSVDSHGDLYVVDQRVGAVDVYGRGAFLPGVVAGSVGERAGSTASVQGLVNPEGFPLSECEFEAVPESQFEASGFKGVTVGERTACVPAAGSIAADREDHVVSGVFSGLVSGTTYRYRLVASSEGVEGGSAQSGVLAFTQPAAPALRGVAAQNVSGSFVDLRGEVDPLGSPTSYRFEYDTAPYVGEERHGVSVPVSGVSIGSGGPTGSSREAVVQHVGGLASGTTYHFRLVAENGVGVTFGADQTFTTLPAPVAAGRGYELVTPASREGGSDLFARPLINNEVTNTADIGTPAQTGDGFMFETFSSFGPFPAASYNGYVFKRNYGKGEWEYVSLTDPGRGVQTISAQSLFTPDLSQVALTDSVGAQVGSEGRRRVGLVGKPGGPYAALHEDVPSHGVGEQHETVIVGASRDLSHVILQSEDPGTCPGPENVGLKVTHGDVLCEWDGGYETLEDGSTRPEMKLVNLNSEGELLSACGAALGGGGPTAPSAGGASWGYRAVSTDGSRVLFTAPDPTGSGAGDELSGTGCWNAKLERETGMPAQHPPRLYMRVGGQTLNLSAPEPGLTEPGSKEPGERPVAYPAAFAGASEDDSRVFFVTRGWLTANHPKAHDQELYECEILTGGEGKPECRLTRVSTGESGSEAETEGADVMAVTAVSGQAQAVYYLAFAALAPGASKHEVTIDAGLVNLYRYVPAVGSTPASTTFVTAVDTLDDPMIGAVCDDGVLEVAPCSNVNWYTTPDGRYLLFGASVPIDGYNEAYGCPVPLPKQYSQNVDGRCLSLYRYDAQAAQHGAQPIVCVSCNPDGGPPAGNAQFTRSAPGGVASAPVRAMSDDGSYVFFDAFDQLVPEATGGSLFTYQWHEGHISLIGPGNDPAPTFFLGYSPYLTPGGGQVEGGSVFIGTHARLARQDTNSVGDIYDARVCEPGAPCIEAPTAGTTQCEGGSCQTPPPAPLDATPGSLTFSGPGNPIPPPPAKAETAAQHRAKELVKALKACRKKRNRHNRATCEKAAHKKYGPVKAARKSSRAKRASTTGRPGR